MPARSTSPTRRLATALLATALLCGASSACNRVGEDADVVPPNRPDELGTPASTAAPPDPAVARADAGPTQHPVGMTFVSIPDEGRGHPLGVHVRYPASAGGGGPDAAPARGAFPLVLMAHGYLLPPDGYERLMQGVAARGYTVAAPDFPHTSPKGDGNRADLVNQPAELGLVADGIIAESARPGALVPPVNRPERLAVMGHSDGGLTAAAMAYNDTYRDPRVAAVVVMSGGLALFPGGWSVPGPPPLLAIHGDADAVNPPSASTDLIAALPDNVPRYLVTVQGGDHVGPYMGETALVGLATVIADFLYVHLERNGERFADERLHADANAAPLTLTAE